MTTGGLSSNSFLPPNLASSNILPENIPSPLSGAVPTAPSSSPAGFSIMTPGGAAVSPGSSGASNIFAPTGPDTVSPIISSLLSGDLAPEDMAQIIRDLPSLLSSLSPDEQYQFLQLIFSSNILNSMFNSLNNPQVQSAFNALVGASYDSGLLSQIAPDDAVLSEDQQGALKDALQSKIVQNLSQLDTTTIPANQEQGQEIPQDASTLQLTVPLSDKNTMSQATANLVAKALTSGVDTYFAPMSSTGQTITPQQAMAQDILTTLLAMQLTEPHGGKAHINIPTQQTTTEQLTQQLNQISDELTHLGQTATNENWNMTGLKNFITVPTELLTLLKSVLPDDSATTNYIKTWIANSPAVTNAILTRANETYQEKFDFLKTMLTASTAQLPQAMVKEQQMRQQLFDQILMQAPALLNVFKLKDMVAIFGDNIKQKHAALLFAFKRMVYNAAHEIIIVANGKPTFEYTDVGEFHRELPILAHKLEVMLPKSAEELDFDTMQVISKQITLTFTYIKENEPSRVYDILKRHPRTLLYFLAIDSPITANLQFPRTQSFGDTKDAVALNTHFKRILDIVKKFEKNSEFLKHQPKVLEAFIDEAKYDPTGEITKTSLDIIHKAVADCSGFIDLE